MSTQVENYMRLAENAFEVDNFEEAYTYSTKVMEYEPDNWRAACIKGISVTGKAKMADPRFNEMIGTIRMVANQIPENELPKIAMKFAMFAIGYYTKKCELLQHDEKKGEHLIGLTLEVMHLLGLAFTLAPNVEYAKQIVTLYRNVISVGENDYLGFVSISKVNINQEAQRISQMDYILSIAESYLRTKDPGYQSVSIENVTQYMKPRIEEAKAESEKRTEEILAQSKNKSGCFIATAVYGDYEAPEVLVLRRFRDNVLGQSVLGRTFIRTYYATSPRIADWLRFHDSIKGGVKKLLDRFVDYLRDKE